MRKRIIRSLTATVLITSIMGMTVLADEEPAEQSCTGKAECRG